MSVMAETSQLAIGPYVAIAAVGLALYAWTAVCREALVVNVYCGGGEGEGGVEGGVIPMNWWKASCRRFMAPISS